MLRQEQQSFALEEIAGGGAADGFEDILLAAEILGQRRAGIFGAVGRVAIDHDHQQVDILREGALHVGFALPPLQVWRHQLVDVGVDPQPAHGDDPADHGQHQQAGNDPARAAAAEFDDVDD